MRVVELDAVGLDVDAAVEASARAAGDAFEDARPHVQLDLLGHLQAVVEDVGELVAAACPGLDLEHDLGGDFRSFAGEWRLKALDGRSTRVEHSLGAGIAMQLADGDCRAAMTHERWVEPDPAG
jgi:hypothetical protein